MKYLLLMLVMIVWVAFLSFNLGKINGCADILVKIYQKLGVDSPSVDSARRYCRETL